MPKWLERLALFIGGAATFWLLADNGLLLISTKSSVQSSIERMKTRHFFVLGYDPDMRDLWRLDHRTRDSSAEGMENWTAVTFKTKDEMDAAVRRMMK